MKICDDCRKEYAGPAYYTFPPELCGGYHDHTTPQCTGNICPDCAGPFLEPDEPDDVRRPIVDFYVQ